MKMPSMHELKQPRWIAIASWGIVTFVLICIALVLYLGRAGQETQIAELQAQATSASGLQDQVDTLQKQLDDETALYGTLREAVIGEAGQHNSSELAQLLKDCHFPKLTYDQAVNPTPAQKQQQDQASACYKSGTDTYIQEFIDSYKT